MKKLKIDTCVLVPMESRVLQFSFVFFRVLFSILHLKILNELKKSGNLHFKAKFLERNWFETTKMKKMLKFYLKFRQQRLLNNLNCFFSSWLIKICRSILNSMKILDKIKRMNRKLSSNRLFFHFVQFERFSKRQNRKLLSAKPLFDIFAPLKNTWRQN